MTNQRAKETQWQQEHPKAARRTDGQKYLHPERHKR